MDEGGKPGITINNGNVQVISGVQDSTVIQNNYGSAIDRETLQSLIAAVRRLAPPTLDEAEQEGFDDSLVVIEQEAASPSPRKSFLRRSIDVLKVVKGTAEFGAAVVALTQFVQTFHIM